MNEFLYWYIKEHKTVSQQFIYIYFIFNINLKGKIDNMILFSLL